MSTASREDSSSTSLHQLGGGSWRCHHLFAYCNTTHSVVYLAQSSAVGALYYCYVLEKGPEKLVVYPTAAAAEAARPPQPSNRATVGAVGSCCRPVYCTTHTVSDVSCSAKVALPALIVTQKMSENQLFKYYVLVAGHILVDKQVTPISRT